MATSRARVGAQFGYPHHWPQPRTKKIVLSQDFVTEALEVNGKTFCYRQIEGSFTQPNAQVCQKNADVGV